MNRRRPVSTPRPRHSGAFHEALDDAIPEAVQPLRTKIVDAAIELADKLVDAQYQFNRKLVSTADRALSKADGQEK